MDIIKFYGRTKNPKYLPFSNFYQAEFIDSSGNKWKTTEHYFQAMKFLPHDIISIGFKQEKLLREYIQQLPSPADAAKEGRRRDLPLRKDWNDEIEVLIGDFFEGFLVKDYCMWEALYYKFTQHPKLLQLLCETGSAEIIEDSPIDYYWGCGKTGNGKNMLGKLLMKLRTFLTCPTPNVDCEDCQDCFNEGESIPRYKKGK